jgi:hypothetical protein
MGTGSQPKFRRISFVLGWCLVLHFGYNVMQCYHDGTLENLCWLSHIATLLGGMGAIFQNRKLISIALVSLLEFHTCWLIDILMWLIFGKFVLGITSYLQGAPITLWLQASNHFYALPFLLLLAIWQGGIEKYAWVWVSLLFTSLVLISFFFLPAHSNVNSAHRLWPGLDRTFFKPLDHLPRGFYLLSLIAINTLGNFLPMNLLLYYFMGVQKTKMMM